MLSEHFRELQQLFNVEDIRKGKLYILKVVLNYFVTGIRLWFIIGYCIIQYSIQYYF